MRVFAVAAASLVAIVSQVQYCPAPFVLGLGAMLGMDAAAIGAADGALATIGSGAVAGGVGKISRRMSRWPIVKRAPVNLPPGVSQESYQQCQDQLKGDDVHVEISGSAPDSKSSSLIFF